MIVLDVKKHGLQYYDVWYAKEPFTQAGIVVYKSSEVPIGKNVHVKNTLITDLTVSEEEIIATFSKNCRYEIRRAEREQIDVTIKCGQEVSVRDIEEFTDYFLEFRRSKNFAPLIRATVAEELEHYRKHDAVAVSVAYCKGIPVVYHTYLIDESRVRLFQSASLFRLEEEISAKIIGMANRYLHREDILYFKRAGKTEYDWGGAGKTEEVASITQFKESFGGTSHEFYDCRTCRGVKARIYELLVKMRNSGK